MVPSTRLVTWTPAELDRWTVFDVEPSVEDWLDWANDNVSTMVWDFVNQNRQHLEHADEFEPNKVYPRVVPGIALMSVCKPATCLTVMTVPLLSTAPRSVRWVRSSRRLSGFYCQL